MRWQNRASVADSLIDLSLRQTLRQSQVGAGKIRTIEARMRFLATHLKQQLAEIPGMQMKTNMEPELSGGVVKCKLAKMATKTAYDTLWERQRISIASTLSGDSEGLRFSPHIYNSKDDIDRAAASVKALA